MKKLMFLAMLFVLTIFTAANVSAQKLCSKKSDGVTVNFELGNATLNVFELIPVDESCNEIREKLQTVPNDGSMYKFNSYKDAVFRVRQIGTGRLLVEIVIDPAKPLMIVQTGFNDSNPELLSAVRQDNGASNREKTELKESENKTADTEAAPQDVSASVGLFKETDKNSCSPPAPGKK